jgi:tetratricopeptide (TPR) repeat protein
LFRALARRYKELKEYTIAVGVLERAIALDPKDEWGYNELAWIKATCPDDSVRNGSEAVAAATKACELTEWKNWRFIDTLAAALAEAEEFKRAIQMQEQALRIGNPTEAEVTAMKERLSLYQQSQPFRTKPK